VGKNLRDSAFRAAPAIITTLRLREVDTGSKKLLEMNNHILAISSAPSGRDTMKSSGI